jgi:hypothetical protein
LARNPATSELIRLKRSAHQNEATEKPSIRELTRRIKTAFITKAKRPRERIVTGSVKSRSSGRMKVFTTPSTTAVIRALRKLSTTTPSRIDAVT